MKVIIDRFEGDFAICEMEDQTMVQIERSRLPKGVKDGDVLILDGDHITNDSNDTRARQKKIEEMMNDLWE